MRLRSHKGFGLLLMVAIIAIAGIVLGSAVWVLANQNRQLQTRVNETKAYYLAQAGVMRAVYDWFVSNAAEANRRYAALGPTVITGSNQFRTGVDADFAYFDHSAAGWVTTAAAACTQAGNNCARMRAWTLRNIKTAGNITATHVRVSWTGGAQTVAQVVLNGTNVFTGAAANGTLIDITDTALASGATWTGNTTYIQWSAQPNGNANCAVTIQWTFSDNSATVDSTTYGVTFWNGQRPTTGRPTQRTFQITSTGQVKETAVGAPDSVATVRAVVAGNVAAPEIIDWDELSKNLAIL